MLTLASALTAPSTVTRQKAEARAIPDAGASQLHARAGSRANDVFAVAVGTRQAADIDALARAADNARDGASLLQAADQGLDSIRDALKRMKELATAATKSAPSINEGAITNAEFERLRAEIDRIADETVFNGTKVLKGIDIALQAGTGSASSDDITIKLQAATVASLEPDLANDNIRSVSAATQALTDVTNAIAVLDDIEAKARAAAVRLQAAQRNLSQDRSALKDRSAELLDRPVTLESAEQLAALISEQFLSQAVPAISDGLANGLRGLLLSSRLQPATAAQPSDQAPTTAPTESGKDRQAAAPSSNDKAVQGASSGAASERARDTA